MPLFFCLFFSAAAASLWFNRLPENIQETLGILGRAWTSRPQCRFRADEGAVYSVFVRRAGLAAVVWLAGMTPCSLAVLLRQAFWPFHCSFWHCFPNVFFMRLQQPFWFNGA